MVNEIEYKDADGKPQKAAYVSQGAVYQLGARPEKFAQLCAVGVDPLKAYCQAFEVELLPDLVPEIKTACNRLLHTTTVVLRIQELQKPVLRKLRRKIEYNLQSALEQCQTAYDLAFEQADSKGMLAAIRMQAELAKLLSQEVNVNHRYGLLDDASTEVLLEMRKRVEVEKARQNGKLKVSVGKIETVSGEGGEAPSGTPNRVPSEAVPN